MTRGRNKTHAERALELICTMAGVPFNEFQEMLKKLPLKMARIIKKVYFLN